MPPMGTNFKMPSLPAATVASRSPFSYDVVLAIADLAAEALQVSFAAVGDGSDRFVFVSALVTALAEKKRSGKCLSKSRGLQSGLPRVTNYLAIDSAGSNFCRCRRKRESLSCAVLGWESRCSRPGAVSGQRRVLSHHRPCDVGIGCW